jgi:hypothetical protein
MRFQPEEVENRREFFRTGARYGLLALLAAAGGLAARPRTPARAGCIRRNLCEGCAIFDGCQLPQALSARRVREGG